MQDHLPVVRKDKAMDSFGVDRLLVWLWYKCISFSSADYKFFEVCLFFLFIFIAIAIKRITAQIAIEIVDARNIIVGYCCRIIWWCLYFDNVTATI